MKREAYEVRRALLQKRQAEVKAALGLGHLEVGFHAASQTLQEAHFDGAQSPRSFVVSMLRSSVDVIVQAGFYGFSVPPVWNGERGG